MRTVEPGPLRSDLQGARLTRTQHVRVEGTSYQRGRQYGTAARARVRLSVQAYQQAFAHFAGWDWPTVRREAARFEAPIGKFRPAYLEEMRGIADGAGLDLTDVLAINVRTEVMYSAKARNAPREPRLPLSAAPSPTSQPRASQDRCSSARTGTGSCTRRRRWSCWSPGRTTARTSSRRSRPACRQDRDERRRARPGHQRPGDRRGSGEAGLPTTCCCGPHSTAARSPKRSRCSRTHAGTIDQLPDSEPAGDSPDDPFDPDGVPEPTRYPI